MILTKTHYTILKKFSLFTRHSLPFYLNVFQRQLCPSFQRAYANYKSAVRRLQLMHVINGKKLTDINLVGQIHKTQSIIATGRRIWRKKFSIILNAALFLPSFYLYFWINKPTYFLRIESCDLELLWRWNVTNFTSSSTLAYSICCISIFPEF